MRRFIYVFFLTVSFLGASAALGKCSDLKKELLAMEKAHSQVLTSMVDNHEMFAASLERYAQIGESAGANGKQKNLPLVFEQMQSTAQVFRKRGVEGRKLQKDLDDSTHELLNRVLVCLRN